MARLTIPVPMRWSDIDGYGHVNNAAMLTLLEEARVATFWDTGTPAGNGSGSTAGGGAGAAEGDQSSGATEPSSPAGTADDDARRAARVLTGGADADSHTLVARQEIEYLAPLGYSQEPVSVQLWIGHIGGASLEVCYEVYSPQGTLCARAASSVVMVNAATGRPRRLSDHERQALQALLEDPITFRRRS